MTGKGDTRAVVVPAVVLVVTALFAARDRLAVGEAGLVEALNGNGVLGTAPFEPLLLVVMAFGTLPGVVAVAVVTALLVKPWQPAVGVLAAGMAGWLVSGWLKDVVGRGRPVEFLDARTLDISGGYAAITGAGYPSGHTTVAFAMAAVVAPWVPARWRWAPWVVASLVGVARIYVAAHFPLDVVGGAALGMVVGGLVNLALPEPADAARRTA